MDREVASEEFLILGPPRLTRGKKNVRFHSAKAAALLAYLVCRPGVAHSRESLAALLWGNMPDRKARHSLRQALYSVRRALGEAAGVCLVVDSQTVTFSPAPQLYIDYLVMDRFIDGGNFQEAVILYQGELLEGVGFDDSPAFEEWLFLSRDRTAQRVIGALGALVDRLLKDGKPSEAVRNGQRLVHLDPLNESAYQRLMRALAAAGELDAVRRTFRQCRETLQRELGVDPTAETSDLYEGLTSAAREPHPKAIPVDPAPELDYPYIGCEWELAHLEDRYGRAAAGQGNLVFIEGAAGSGKTELVLEFWRRTLGQYSLLLLHGRAYETQLESPYSVWVDALAALKRPELQERLDGLAAIWRQQLGQLVPGLALPVPEDERLSSAENHLRFMQGVVQGLIFLSSNGPVCLFFDDLHWCDPASLELFHYAARQCRGYPVFFVGAYRSEAVFDNANIQRFFSEPRFDTIQISPLQPVDIEKLLGLMGYVHFDAAAARLARHCQGNRLVLFETLRFLQISNSLDSLFTDASLPIPPRIRDLVEVRMSRLDEKARRVLAVAAVIGRQFNLVLVRHTSGLPEMELLAVLEQLVAQAFLVEVENTDGEGIDFHHHYVARVVYTSLRHNYRKALHRRTAEALLRLYPDEPSRMVQDTAFHFEQAGDTRALESLQQASVQAERMFALTEAVNFLSRALDFQARFQREDVNRRFELLLQREGLYAQQGQRSLQAGDIAALLSLAEQIASPVYLALVLIRNAGYLSDTGSVEESNRAAAQALSIYQEAGDRNGEAQALREMGYLYWTTGAYGLALDYCRRALSLHRQTGEIEGEASALHNLAEIYRGLNSPRRAVTLYEQSLQLSWARRDHQRQCLSLYGMAHALHQAGSRQRALEVYQQTLEQAELAGDKVMLSRTYHETATLLVELKNWAAAAQSMGQAVEISREIGYATGAAHSLVGLGYLLSGQRDVEGSRAALEEAVHWFGRLEDTESEQRLTEILTRIDSGEEMEEPASQMGWVKTYVTLDEGKVYCEFESPVASPANTFLLTL